MTIFQAILLGLVQGLTEFIPVSSSAHLVLVPWLLGWQFPAGAKFVFDVLVQLGTLAAVIVYFWKDLWAIAVAVLQGLARGKPWGTPEARLGWLVVLATIPAVVLGLLFKDFFEAAFGSPTGTAALLLVTAAALVLAERVGRGAREVTSIKWLDALLIGLAQAVAILPGVSRSGATISAGRALGLARPAAARFSFLMSVPVMVGAGVVAAKDLLDMPNFGGYVLPIGLAMVVAAVVGFVCIRWLLSYLGRGSLYGFAVYCAAAGLGCLAWGLVR
ncbi:MAG: undecaprenyl-diphosphatase UppP [Anaerolineales bacterium]|nr:undecaprenyl-diphosphatase UppP [Anaerolineales bacterium]